MPDRIVTYMAMVFRRSDHEITHDDPISPTGGSFYDPVPSNGLWSRVPLPGVDPLYVSLRIFTSDGLFPQEADWSPPVIFVKNGEQGDTGASAAPAINGINGLNGDPGTPGQDFTFDMTIPPKPTGLTTIGAFNSIIIKWDSPDYSNHAHTEIWRNTVDDRMNSELIGMSPGSMFSDIPPDTKLANEYYYWIRFVSTSGIIGPYNDDDGLVATTANDPAHMIELLSRSFDDMATSNVFGTTKIIIPAEIFAIKGTAAAGGVGADTPAVYPFIVSRTPQEFDPPGGPFTGPYAVFMDTTYITNLTATNFVGETIIADTVTAGISIDSPVITGGTLDIGSGQFTVDAIGRVDAKAIRILNPDGSVLLQSGGYLDYANIGGLTAPAPNATRNIYRGIWDGGITNYVAGDEVLYQNSSWVALINVPVGEAPPTLPTTANTYWSLRAKAGDIGTAGFNTVTVYIYKRESIPPTLLPTLQTTYTFSTGALANLNNGWTKAIPAGTDDLYVMAATAISRVDTDTIEAAEWTTPTKLSTVGADGAPGINSASVFLFQRTVSSVAPSVPFEDLTYTYDFATLTGNLNGWSKTMPVTGGGYRWMISATAISVNSTDTILASEWSTPSLIAQDGRNADGFSTEFVEYTAADWTNHSGSGGPSIVTEPLATGGKCLSVGNNSGNDQAWLTHNTNIPFDPTATYRIKARVRRTLGTGKIYLGVMGIAADGTTPINTSGTVSTSQQFYLAANAVDPATTFSEYVGYFSGNTIGGTGYSPSLGAPGRLHPDCKFFRPLILVNYAGVAGVSDIDTYSIEKVSVEEIAAYNAKNYVDNLASDSVITPDEKLSLKPEWDSIVAEATATTGKLPAQAIILEVSTTAFNAAYSTLNTYLNTTLTLFSSMTVATTGVIRATWNTNWSNYYNARVDLINALNAKTKELADAAQTTATITNNLITDIASDSKFTPVEKTAVRKEWNTIYAEKVPLELQAAALLITTEKTTFTAALQTLGTYLNGGTAYTISSTPPSWITDANLSVTTNIVGATFRTNFTNYYNAKIALLNKMWAVSINPGNQITNTNISTYIADLAVGNAQIDNLAVTTVKIGTDQVTVPRSAATAAAVSIPANNTWVLIQTVTLDSAAFPTLLLLTCAWRWNYYGGGWKSGARLRILRNGVEIYISSGEYFIYTISAQEFGDNFPLAFSYLDPTPPDGSNIYRAEMLIPATTVAATVTTRTLTALGMKR